MSLQMFRVGSATLACFFGFLIFASAQSPSERSIQTASEAVLVDFVVRDEEGRLVKDLQPAEVRILENGEFQELISFATSSPLSATEDSSSTGPDDTIRPAADDSPSVAATRSTAVPFPSLVALVFEGLSVESRHLTKQAALEFVREQAGPETWIGVFVIDQSLHILQEFTSSREALSLAVERATSLTPSHYPDLTKEVLDRMEEYENMVALERPQAEILNADAPRQDSIRLKTAELILNMTRLSQNSQRQQEGQNSLFNLMRIIRGMGGLEGRKSLIYFSEGLEVPPSLEEVYRGAIGAANLRNVSIYTVDARGLQTERQLETARRAQELAARSSRRQQLTFTSLFTLEQIKLVDTSLEAIRMNPQGVLMNLAESTGGFLIANTNHFSPGLARVAEEVGFHYEAAYVPRNLVYDGRYREIQVLIEREGVEVRSRRGYYAMPPSLDFLALPYEFPLLRALEASQTVDELAFETRALRFESNESGSDYLLTMELPLGSLSYEKTEGGRYSARLSMLALIRNRDRNVVFKFTQHYPLRVPQENFAGVKDSFAIFLRTFHLEPGKYELETAVCDHQSGKLATYREPLEVRPPEPGVRMSSLVLVREARKRDRSDDENHPLNYRNLRFLPRVRSVEHQAGAALPLFLVIYPDRESSDEPSLSLELFRDGQSFQTLRAELPKGRRPDGSIPFVISLPLDWFRQGTYQVAARTEQGSSNTEERFQFRVD